MHDQPHLMEWLDKGLTSIYLELLTFPCYLRKYKLMPGVEYLDLKSPVLSKPT